MVIRLFFVARPSGQSEYPWDLPRYFFPDNICGFSTVCPTVLRRVVRDNEHPILGTYLGKHNFFVYEFRSTGSKVYCIVDPVSTLSLKLSVARVWRRGTAVRGSSHVGVFCLFFQYIRFHWVTSLWQPSLCGFLEARPVTHVLGQDTMQKIM